MSPQGSGAAVGEGIAARLGDRSARARVRSVRIPAGSVASRRDARRSCQIPPGSCVEPGMTTPRNAHTARSPRAPLSCTDECVGCGARTVARGPVPLCDSCRPSRNARPDPDGDVECVECGHMVFSGDLSRSGVCICAACAYDDWVVAR